MKFQNSLCYVVINWQEVYDAHKNLVAKVYFSWASPHSAQYEDDDVDSVKMKNREDRVTKLEDKLVYASITWQECDFFSHLNFYYYHAEIGGDS